VLALYADRIPGATPDLDEFVLKRGYDKKASGKRVLAMDDVLTTGGSLKKTILAARACGADVIGAAALCNRGGVTVKDIGNPPDLRSLWNLNLKSFPADACPLCKDKVPVNTNVGKGRDFLAKQQAGN
jgi:orotate phosphoribosyltransferase